LDAERGVRPVAVGRHNWTFAGSDEGGRRAAALTPWSRRASSTTSTRRLGSPTSWRTCPIPPARRIELLMPWNWKRVREKNAAA